MLYCKKYFAERSPFCSCCFENSPDTNGSIAFSLVLISIFDCGSRYDLVYRWDAIHILAASVLVSSAMGANAALPCHRDAFSISGASRPVFVKYESIVPINHSYIARRPHTLHENLYPSDSSHALIAAEGSAVTFLQHGGVYRSLRDIASIDSSGRGFIHSSPNFTPSASRSLSMTPIKAIYSVSANSRIKPSDERPETPTRVKSTLEATVASSTRNQSSLIDRSSSRNRLNEAMCWPL